MRQRIYVVSDSVGETCELVVRAAAIQFPEQAIETVRIPFVDDDQVIYDLVLHAKEEQATIAFTIVHATIVVCLQTQRVPTV